jgi:hypothetical protein
VADNASGVLPGSKGDADPGATVGEPLVVGRQSRVRQMIQHDRQTHLPGELIPGLDTGVPGVISRKFSVREIATKSLVVARNDYICKNNTFCYTLLHTPREMQPYWAAKPGVSRQIRGHRNHLINSQL